MRRDWVSNGHRSFSDELARRKPTNTGRKLTFMEKSFVPSHSTGTKDPEVSTSHKSRDFFTQNMHVRGAWHSNPRPPTSHVASLPFHLHSTFDYTGDAILLY